MVSHMLSVVCLGAFMSLGVFAQPTRPPPKPIPPLVTATWEKLIGVWTADNSRFKGADEPTDVYAIEWKWGLGRQTLTGRLYGLREGEEVGTFWEFREFWHPGEGQVLTAQFGAGGIYGVGPNEHRADGTSEMLQTFYDPSGLTTRVDHRSELNGDVHITRSFDVGADGQWTPRREYIWKRGSPRSQK
ncbi:MAG: hypothetical protein ACRD3V_00450 [Vicinamibacteria bacterium]